MTGCGFCPRILNYICFRNFWCRRLVPSICRLTVTPWILVTDNTSYSRLFLYLGFEAHRRKRRLDIKSRPLFDRKVDTKDQRGNLNELFRKRRKMELPSSKSQRQDKEAVATKFGVISRRRKAESEGTSCSQQRPDHATTNGEVHGETRGLCEMSRGAALSIQKNYNRPGGSSCKEVECEEKDSSTVQFDKLNSFAVGKSMSVSLVSCEYTESGDSSSEQ